MSEQHADNVFKLMAVLKAARDYRRNPCDTTWLNLCGALDDTEQSGTTTETTVPSGTKSNNSAGSSDSEVYTKSDGSHL